MNKFAKVVFISLAALSLAACSNNNNNSESAKPNKSANLKIRKVKSKKGTLTANYRSPQRTVAVITAYAGLKYANQWGDALSNAKANGLVVTLKNQADYMNEGSGVGYFVTNDLAYTLKQTGNTTEYYLFADQKQIASVTMKEMVDYLNERNSDKLVKNLTNSAKIEDERNDSANASSNSNNTNDSSDDSSKSNIEGDAGLYTIPSEFQGVWYTVSYGKMYKIVFTDHEIIENGQTTELHKMKRSFIDKIEKMPKSYQDKTMKWGRASMMTDIKKNTWFNVMGWNQTAGDGESYRLHTEKGQNVLVLASDAGPWTDSVAWKTPQLAKEYAKTKFSDLHYRDDDY
ncbi:hypothetical protein [uncultured Lactobacillus sp.]|uniref:hypothetical protein n=1 Tax=uncultured Lactobacillus sp. TaxID=153152 RepID=UPI002804CA79|nr:hypothetical protein [uncultured Lactobacillus sp.]